MLDYGWGNPSTMMFPGEEQESDSGPGQDSDPARQILHNYVAGTTPFLSPNDALPPQQPTGGSFTAFSHLFSSPQTLPHVPSSYDPRADSAASHYSHHHHHMLALDHQVSGSGAGPGFLIVPKREEVSQASMEFPSRIGLNLGGRTYFSSSEDDFVNRLYRRSRPAELGSSSSPRCQAEGCNADLTHAKHYHRRHKVCEFHSKASTVIAAGMTQRFCQQCSRFHLLAEFDNGKRSCRKRLADHNRRRRKTQHLNQPNVKPSLLNTDNSPRSPADCGGPSSSSSVTVALSPPPMPLDCFQKRRYQASTPSGSATSLFYSGG